MDTYPLHVSPLVIPLLRIILLRNLNSADTPQVGYISPTAPTAVCASPPYISVLSLCVRIVRTGELLAKPNLIKRTWKRKLPTTVSKHPHSGCISYILPPPRTPPSLLHVYPSTICVDCLLLLLRCNNATLSRCGAKTELKLIRGAEVSDFPYLLHWD